MYTNQPSKRTFSDFLDLNPVINLRKFDTRIQSKIFTRFRRSSVLHLKTIPYTPPGFGPPNTRPESSRYHLNSVLSPTI